MILPALYLINKPPGITSFQFLSPIKKRLGTKKIGHAGTLDKFAEGLMVVLAGQATRFAEYLANLDKSYCAELSFGAETDTLDPHGRVAATGPLPHRDSLLRCMRQFQGKIDQTPPEFSAIHIQGKRAYQRARSGEEFTMPTRRIHIYSLRLLNYDGSHASISLECSKGTYVRSLARDIAHCAGTRAHLTQLQRTSIGAFTSLNALDLDDFLALSNAEIGKRRIWGSKLLQAVPHIQKITISDTILPAIRNGKQLYLSDIAGASAELEPGLSALVNSSDDIQAIVEVPEDLSSAPVRIKYRRVFYTLDI